MVDYSVKADSQDWNQLILTPIAEDAYGSQVNNSGYYLFEIGQQRQIVEEPKVAAIEFQPPVKPVGSQGEMIPPHIPAKYRYHWVFKHQFDLPQLMVQYLTGKTAEVTVAVVINIKMPTPTVDVAKYVVDVSQFVAGAVVQKLRGRRNGSWLTYFATIVGAWAVKQTTPPQIEWTLEGTANDYWKASGTFCGVSYDFQVRANTISLFDGPGPVPDAPQPEYDGETAEWWEVIELDSVTEYNVTPSS